MLNSGQARIYIKEPHRVKAPLKLESWGGSVLRIIYLKQFTCGGCEGRGGIKGGARSYPPKDLLLFCPPPPPTPSLWLLVVLLLVNVLLVRG